MDDNYFCYVCDMRFMTLDKLNSHKSGITHIFKSSREIKKIPVYDPVNKKLLIRRHKNKLNRLKPDEQIIFLNQLEEQRIKRYNKFKKYNLIVG